MKHQNSINHLGRKTAHRKAMLSNMACSLIMHKKISTTVAKAKALKVFVEPLITKSKDDTTHSRRQVFSVLQDKEAVSELFREIASKVGNRPGGYTRIFKTGNRLGDAAEMCLIELVDYNENLLKDTSSKSKSRRRRGTKKSSSETVGTSSAVVEDATIVEDKETKQDKLETVNQSTNTVDSTEIQPDVEVSKKTEESDNDENLEKNN